MQKTSFFPELAEQARRAFYWTSFSPDVRGEQTRQEHGEQLAADIEELKAAGIEAETVEAYRQKFKSLFSGWLSARSRCASSMITGPARFNTTKADKANRSEERHYEVFMEWRERAKRSIIRKSKPAKTFSSELERYQSELESAKANHELMKQGNKRISAAKKSGEDISQYLTETFGIKPHMIDWTMKFGFGLQNNLANIKRIEERISILQRKQTAAETVGETSKKYENFELIMNHAADRIQIKFDTRQSEDITKVLKSNGFKWAPSVGCWQRQLTGNAMFSLKHYVLPSLTKEQAHA